MNREYVSLFLVTNDWRPEKWLVLSSWWIPRFNCQNRLIIIFLGGNWTSCRYSCSSL